MYLISYELESPWALNTNSTPLAGPCQLFGSSLEGLKLTRRLGLEWKGPLVILGSRTMHDLYSHLKITQSIHLIDFRLYACVREDAINSRSTLVHTYARKNCMARTLIHGFVTLSPAWESFVPKCGE